MARGRGIALWRSECIGPHCAPEWRSFPDRKRKVYKIVQSRHEHLRPQPISSTTAGNLWLVSAFPIITYCLKASSSAFSSETRFKSTSRNEVVVILYIVDIVYLRELLGVKAPLFYLYIVRARRSI